MHKTYKYIFLLFFVITCKLTYSQDKITIEHADSLIGKVVNGEQVREAIGNVRIIHNNISINAHHVIQYVDQNKAELYGNVKVVKDTLTIFAPAGIYHGNEGKVYCPRGATLNDSKVTLKANYGEYTFATEVANFRGNVNIYDSRSYTINSDELDYYRNEERSVARGNVKIDTDSAVVYSDDMTYEKRIGKVVSSGNVKIESDSTLITSQKLTYFELERRSIAEENVRAEFINKNAVVYGDYGENHERTNYSLVRGNARLIQVEKDEDSEDTVFIYSRQMESFRSSPEYYVARDSVEMIRNEFLSVSELCYYYREPEGRDDEVVTLSGEPVVWRDNMQVTGDSIFAFFKDEIDRIFINRNAFALQKLDDFADRYDQITGVFMEINFTEGNVSRIRVDTNAASIYYVFENSLANGMNRSEGEIITLNFADDNVTKVNITGNPVGSYYPEPFLSQSDRQLQGFLLRTNKPVRRENPVPR